MHRCKQKYGHLDPTPWQKFVLNYVNYNYINGKKVSLENHIKFGVPSDGTTTRMSKPSINMYSKSLRVREYVCEGKEDNRYAMRKKW